MYYIKIIMNFLLIVFFVQTEISKVTYALDCPKTPAQVGSDLIIDAEGELSSLLKLGSGELKAHIEKKVHELFSKYPNADKVVLANMMISIFCQQLDESKQLSEADKIKYIFDFNDKIMKISPPSEILSNKKESVDMGPYLNYISFLKETASLIAKRADEGFNWSYNSSDISAGKSLVSEYNALVKKIKYVLKDDEYIKLLKEVDEEQYPEVAASKVGRLSKEIAIYLTSFESNTALKQTAAALVKRADEGLKWSYNSSDISAGESLVWEYNYLVHRTKNLIGTDPLIQSMEEIAIEQYPQVAASKVGRLAKELENVLAFLEHK